MVEVKADALEQSFEQFEAGDGGVAALKSELDLLKAKIASGAIQGQRPALDGVKSQSANMFTEQYLRRGNAAGLEVKAVGNSTDAIGGYAVPREIDDKIDSTLKAISPIRAIANVVRVGSAGYRKLITNGGTPSGWVGFEAARPESGTGRRQSRATGLARQGQHYLQLFGKLCGRLVVATNIRDWPDMG